jgi:hypothetical protein
VRLNRCCTDSRDQFEFLLKRLWLQGLAVTTFSNRELSGLIGSIYDCALDPGRWDDTLAEVASALKCEHAILSLNDIQRDRVLINRSVGWEPYWLEQRSRHIPEIHEKLTEWLMRQTSLDHPFVASHEIPKHHFDNSPYVRECLRPLGIVGRQSEFMRLAAQATPPVNI